MNGAAGRPRTVAGITRGAAGRKRTRKRAPRPLEIAKAVRWSKVMMAQARIATGFYDRKDVKEMVLEAVLEELARH